MERDANKDERMLYTTLRQNALALADPRNSPALSMGGYLLERGEEGRLRRISIYEERGDSREAMRLLYMNAEALAIWQAMGGPGEVTGTRHRPPRTALLSYGVPFSE